MAPLGPTHCWWSDGLLHYEATRPGARFHIHFCLSLSKTLNDFPKIGKWELNRGGAECAIEGKKGEIKASLKCRGAKEQHMLF